MSSGSESSVEEMKAGTAGQPELRRQYKSGDLLHDWPVGGCQRGEKVGGWARERNSASEL